MARLIVFVIFCTAGVLTEAFQAHGARWTGRIVGGNDADEGQFPYIASLRNAQNFHLCGGAIYNENWVLTASHCIVKHIGEDLKVAVGTINVKTGTIYDVAKILLHPDFNVETMANDIALIRTKTEIVFSDLVKAIPLSTNTVVEGLAVVSGWGNTQVTGSPADTLKFLNMDVITNEKCIEMHKPTGFDVVIYENVLCTLKAQGEGTCNGDSGGPLELNGELIGIVSWGIPCALGLPDAYARISSHISWITSNAT